MDQKKPERSKQMAQSFFERNPNYRRQWRKENIELARKACADYYRKKRIELLTLVGGLECKKCGFNDWRALQVDHVNGNGYLEANNQRNAYRYIKVVKLNLTDYQILCANCNWIKKYENREIVSKYRRKL